jgi:hypothetical protein
MDEVILEPDYLDRVYSEWAIQDRRSMFGNYHPGYWSLQMKYQNAYRNGFNEQRFEEWLYSHGFTVKQQHGKRYLVFNGNNKKLSWFLLKYGAKK